jgi:hypothetical protein
MQRSPRQLSLAEKDARHKMALVFRSYLGQSSKWAIAGEAQRKIDFQIWCGPAMGAFNQWVQGSFLEAPQNRDFLTLAMNILYGAAYMARISWLASQAITLPSGAKHCSPQSVSEILALIDAN